ncbi:25134_t:CDS:2, partial [Racocetra persica]
GIITTSKKPQNQWNFKRKMKLWRLENGHLYIQIKDQPLCRFVPAWDLEFHQFLFNQFYNNDRYINANDCHKKIMCTWKDLREVMFGYKLLGIYQQFNPTDP